MSSTKTKNAAKRYSLLKNKFANTLKGKLNLGSSSKLARGGPAAVDGGAEKTFRKRFDVREGERLAKACGCSLWTTAGPISGLLFISSDKMAFCSDAALRLPNIVGDGHRGRSQLRFHYKVVIPLNKIARANRCRDENKPAAARKCLHVVTKDDFEFWFLESC